MFFNFKKKKSKYSYIEEILKKGFDVNYCVDSIYEGETGLSLHANSNDNSSIILESLPKVLIKYIKVKEEINHILKEESEENEEINEINKLAIEVFAKYLNSYKIENPGSFKYIKLVSEDVEKIFYPELIKVIDMLIEAKKNVLENVGKNLDEFQSFQNKLYINNQNTKSFMKTISTILNTMSNRGLPNTILKDRMESYLEKKEKEMKFLLEGKEKCSDDNDLMSMLSRKEEYLIKEIEEVKSIYNRYIYGDDKETNLSFLNSYLN